MEERYDEVVNHPTTRFNMNLELICNGQWFLMVMKFNDGQCQNFQQLQEAPALLLKATSRLKSLGTSDKARRISLNELMPRRPSLFWS